MKNFNRGGGFGDRKSGGFGGNKKGGFNDHKQGGFGRREFGGHDSGRGSFGGGFNKPGMHKAVCAECGATCEVPFKPTGDRPVYCSNCFKNRDTHGSHTDFRNNNHASSTTPVVNNNLSKEQFEALNAKMDKILRALEHLSSLERTPRIEAAKEVAPKVAVVKETSAKKAVSKPKPVKKAKKK